MVYMLIEKNKYKNFVFYAASAVIVICFAVCLFADRNGWDAMVQLLKEIISHPVILEGKAVWESF